MEAGAEALFQGDIKVPEELAPILKDLTKEILRKGLQDKQEIITFAKNYFDDLSSSTDTN